MFLVGLILFVVVVSVSRRKRLVHCLPQLMQRLPKSVNRNFRIAGRIAFQYCRWDLFQLKEGLQSSVAVGNHSNLLALCAFCYKEAGQP
jgi:hypothetical protein